MPDTSDTAEFESVIEGFLTDVFGPQSLPDPESGPDLEVADEQESQPVHEITDPDPVADPVVDDSLDFEPDDGYDTDYGYADDTEDPTDEYDPHYEYEEPAIAPAPEEPTIGSGVRGLLFFLSLCIGGFIELLLAAIAFDSEYSNTVLTWTGIVVATLAIAVTFPSVPLHWRTARSRRFITACVVILIGWIMTFMSYQSSDPMVETELDTDFDSQTQYAIPTRLPFPTYPTDYTVPPRVTEFQVSTTRSTPSSTSNDQPSTSRRTTTSAPPIRTTAPVVTAPPADEEIVVPPPLVQPPAGKSSAGSARCR